MVEQRAVTKALRQFPSTQAAQIVGFFDQHAEKVEGLYPYYAPDCAVEFFVVRLKEEDGKTFRVGHFENNRLIWKKPQRPEAGFALFGGSLLPQSPNATVIICEGEKASLAIINLVKRSLALNTYIAMTSGGAQSANAANWAPLAGRHVIIWPDNDEPGLKYASAVFQKLNGLAASIRFVNIAQLQLPPSGDAADWVELMPDASLESLGSLPLTTTLPSLANAAASPINDTEPPLPLLRETSGRTDIPITALGPKLGAAAQAIAAAVQCPTAIAANAVLACAAVTVQGFANVRVDGRETPLSLYILTIASSGERKTAVDRLATAPIYDHQKLVQAEYSRQMKDYQAQLKSLPKNAIEPNPPTDPTVLVSDFTIDAMIRSLIHGRPSQGIFMSEGGTFFGGYAMSKEQRLRTSTLLSAVYSGEPISQTRVTARHSANSRRLSAHIQAQPEVVRDFVGDEMLQAQGLLQRFLMSEPPSRIGSRLYARHDISRDPAYQAYIAQMNALLTLQLPTDEDGDLILRTLGLSEAACELWISAYNDIERTSAPGSFLENYQAYASKLPEQILRIAGVISLFEEPDAIEVSETIMRGAISLAYYYLYEAMHLLMSPADCSLVRAKELLEWLKRYQSPMALREIYRNGPKFVRTASGARELLKILIEHGWVKRHEGMVTTADGKTSKENYAVVTDV